MQNEQLANGSIAIAKTYIGQKEATGNNDGIAVEFWHDWMDGSQTGVGYMKGQPWCANFAMWCIYTAASALGITTKILKSASSSAIVAQATKDGLMIPAPIVGCLGFIKAAPGSGKTHDHTFRVLAVNADGTVSSLDGNWSNEVCETSHLISECDFAAVA